MKFKDFIKHLKNKKARPLLAVLIDPDKFNPSLVLLANKSNVHCFLVGGSRLETGNIAKTVEAIKRLSKLPVILFPGDETQLTGAADGLFLPSLLSGRNPDYLIGKQVAMAPLIKRMKLPCMSMAYLLIAGSRVSSTEKVTGTTPMNPSQADKIIHTALAAQQLGFAALYLEAGSGAKNSVPAWLIRKLKKQVSLPLIVGGGINSKLKTSKAIDAGAKMVVVGNALEKDVYLLAEISSCFNKKVVNRPAKSKHKLA